MTTTTAKKPRRARRRKSTVKTMTSESYPVIITDKSYTKKTSVNNKIKIQYSVKLEYSNPVRTNS